MLVKDDPRLMRMINDSLRILDELEDILNDERRARFKKRFSEEAETSVEDGMEA